MVSIWAAGLTKNLWHLRVVNEIDLDGARGCALDVPAGGWPHRPPVSPRPPGPTAPSTSLTWVELADTGHYQTVTQTSLDVNDIAPAHPACG